MSKQVSRSTVYARANATIRERHRAEFDEVLAAEFEKAGMSYTRRLSAQERAERDAAIRLEKARQKAAALREEFGDELFTDPPF